MNTAIVLGIAGLYLGTCLLVGMLPGRKSSDSAAGYVAGDRALGLVVMYFITGATIFSAYAFLGAPGWAFSRGGAALYMLAYGTLGFVPFYFLGPRAARLGKRYGFVTQAEMVAHRFSRPGIAATMALISVLAFVPYLALQMQGAGIVLEAMTGGAVDEKLGALLVYGLVLVYVLKSGVLGVGWTNTFQGVFMLALAWGMGLYLPRVLYGGIGPMFERIAAERPGFLKPPGLTGGGTPWPWSEYTSSVLVSIAGFSVFPHLFMKAFSARDERTIRRTVVLYPSFQLFVVPILILGFAGVLLANAPERADGILPHLMMNADVPPVLVGLFCAGALAASMSSGDAIAHATASIVVRDGWVTALRRPLDAATERLAIRIVLVAVVAVSYGLAVLYTGSLVELLLYAYGPIVQFAPAVYATLFWRRATGRGVQAGLIAGIATNILFASNADLRPFDVHAGVYGLAANLTALVLVSLLTSHEDEEREREFLATSAEPGD
ncbi:MAG: sodium:solute symporter family protein [Planctomycetota bacterium]